VASKALNYGIRRPKSGIRNRQGDAAPGFVIGGMNEPDQFSRY
jgi:hypothetical protein